MARRRCVRQFDAVGRCFQAVTFGDDLSIYFVSGESDIDLSRIGRSCNVEHSRR